ncbi:MAG TPA: hypothetical protein PKL99_03150, partial [Syntrophales bacterium]|nr:hypothetical protein [Syntrophales bacterium]
DRYLRKLFNDRGFVFSREGELETDAFSSRPPASSQGGSFWNMGEQLILDELEKEPIGKADDDEGVS